MIWWKFIAWPWLKKYWMWILFPIGLLVAVVKGLSLLKRPPAVLAPELVGASQKAEEARRLAEEESRLAEMVRQKRVAEVEAVHAEKLQQLSKEQREIVEELKSEPDKLNEYLLLVGKDIRK